MKSYGVPRAHRIVSRYLLAFAVSFSLSALFTRTAAAGEEFPFYYERPITPTELQGKTLRELEMLRATIHARAGLVFLESRLRDYFAPIPAYRPGHYDVTHLSAVDSLNLRTLAEYEASISRAQLKERWDSLLQEHRYAGGEALQSLVTFSADGSVIAAGPSVVGPRWPISLFSAATGERIRLVSWACRGLQALRLAGRDLVAVCDYTALSGAWSSPLPTRSLLIGAKAQADGHRDPSPYWSCLSPDGNIVVVESRGDVTSFDRIQRTQGPTLPLLPGQLISHSPTVRWDGIRSAPFTSRQTARASSLATRAETSNSGTLARVNRCQRSVATVLGATTTIGK